jgi:hypothetical protein
MEEKEKKGQEELTDHDWEIVLEELPDDDWETPEDYKKRKLGFLVEILFALFFLFIIVSFLWAIISMSLDTTSTKTEDKSDWKYAGSIAWLDSDNSIELPGESSSFTLNIRKCKEGTDIFLTSSNSVFVSGCFIPIKFDKKRPFQVYAGHGTRFKDGYYFYLPDGSSEAVFLNFKINSLLGIIIPEPEEQITEEDFISQLKTANKLTIEIKIRDAGTQRIKFSTKGFNWNYIDHE